MTDYSTIIVPSIPNTPMFDDKGRMTDIWQRYFIDFQRVVADPSGALLASRIMATDANGVKVSVSDLTDWIAGTDGRIVVTDDGDGTITINLPPTTAARLLATNSDNDLVSTILSSWIAGTSQQITVTDDGDGTITLSIPAPFRVPATGDDYFSLEADGTPVLKGNATVWDDQQISIGDTRFAGASDPTWTAYKGGQVLAFDKAQDNIIYFTAQLSHKYKASSNIEFHIHTAHADAGAGNSRWNFTYSWADIGSDFPNATTISKTFASPTDADKHELHEFSDTISGAGAVVSSVLLCSLQREGTDAVNDTYDDDIYVVAMDFHLEMDTMGSREEAAK